MSTNIFHDSDDLNDLNGNKKFIAKRAQIGNQISVLFLIEKFIFFGF
jgi:hypothetical protein